MLEQFFPCGEGKPLIELLIKGQACLRTHVQGFDITRHFQNPIRKPHGIATETVWPLSDSLRIPGVLPSLSPMYSGLSRLYGLSRLFGCLDSLGHLVCLVDLVDLVHLVSFNQPNKQDKPNKLNKPNNRLHLNPIRFPSNQNGFS